MPDAPLLETRSLDAFYGDFQALFGVSVHVATGEVVAVIGANGAGKSTLLKTIVGLIGMRSDAVMFDGRPIGGLATHEVVAAGIALVPEGRRLFPSLSVEENLLIGGQLGRSGPWTLARIYELFPVLAERRSMPSTSLSGGQQQMVAIARGLMSNPRLLLCDEISLGLAPIVVRDIYARLPDILSEGISIVIVEQDIVQALGAASRVYCLQGQGRARGGHHAQGAAGALGSRDEPLPNLAVSSPPHGGAHSTRRAADGSTQSEHYRLTRIRSGRAEYPTVVIMDGQSVKTTEIGGPRGFDAFKRVKGRKRHILVDTLGLPIANRVETANVSDRRAGALLTTGLKTIFPAIRTLIAGAGHESKNLALALAEQQGWRPSRSPACPGSSSAALPGSHAIVGSARIMSIACRHPKL